MQKSLLLCILLASCAWAHECLQDELMDEQALNPTPQTYLSSYPYDFNTQPIRLRIDTSYLDSDVLERTCTSVGQVVDAQVTSSSTTTFKYTCKSEDVLSGSMKGYLGTLLNQARDLFQGTLKVMPIQDSLRLTGSVNPQGVYGGVYLTSEYTSGVPNLDCVIFVTARPITQDGGSTSTLAVARVVQDDQYGRPIFGNLNINVAGIDIKDSMFKRNFGVVIHEMTHALGFTLQKLRDINPAPNTTARDITLDVNVNVGANDASVKRTIVRSPRVLSWARKYFGCNTLQGVELENQGGGGTAGSHWEKRMVMNEYMTGTASRNPVFSELTLALLEDTGWYVVNYSRAGQLLWGQGLGCDFSSRGCNNWPRFQGYFCSDADKKGCTADYQGKGACQIGSEVVDAEYQYFPSSATKVGAYELPDYCPVTWGFENGWCFDSGAASSSFENKGEFFGENSRCFDSSLIKDLPVGGSNAQVCYETYCTAPTELRVKVGGYWYICPPGSDIKVIGYGGTISCPNRVQQICANSVIDATWPVFTAISPNSGGPGLRVNITGRNFIDGTTVKIGDDTLDDIVVLSSSQITGKVPSTDRFKNPTNIIEQQVSVIVTDPKGRSSVGYNRFTIKVSLNKEFFKNVLEYLGNNWLVTAAIVAAVVITCLICGYCCYRQKGKAEEADTAEYYYNS